MLRPEHEAQEQPAWSRCEHRALEAAGPGQAPRESTIARGGDRFAALLPIQAALAVGCQRLTSEIRGLEGHGHAVAGDRSDHRKGIANATFVEG